jgi:hypothetical protein
VRHGHSADHDNPSRYRIEAMAHTAADVVRNLGGLLFDRRCLGWDPVVAHNSSRIFAFSALPARR